MVIHPWGRGLGTVVAAAVVVAAVGWLLRTPPLRLEIVTATVGPLLETIDEDGEVRVRDRYTVTAPVSGRLARIDLRPGDAVAAGTVVARIEPAALDERTRAQAVRRLEGTRDVERAAGAAVRQAQAALAQARRDRDRARALARDGIATAEAGERAEVALQIAEREAEAADFRAQAAAHDVQTARAALLAADAGGATGARPILLRAPIDGRVLSVPDQSARLVAGGQLLLDIGDVSRLEVAVDLLSTDAVRVRPGDRLLIERWGGDRPLSGRVRVVEPAAFTKVSALGIEEQRVNVIGDLTEEAAPLGDRYQVEVKIVRWEAAAVVKVPWSALFREGGGWRVFVVEDGRARRRNVTIGHQSATEVELLEGLRAGEAVVRHPTEQVADGVRVSPG